MSATGLEVFDTTLQKTNIWLQDIAEETGRPDRQRAYQVLRAGLHALRDRLTPEEAAQLGAQLPMLVRGIYYEGWRPGATPTKERHREEFLEHIRKEAQNVPDINPEQVADVTFKVLAKHVTEGEINQIKAMMPEELRNLWH